MRTKATAKKVAKKALAKSAVKRGRGRPRKAAAAAVAKTVVTNGRQLTAAKIIKQQMKATQDAQRMHDALMSIVDTGRDVDHSSALSACRAMQKIAKIGLFNTSRPV